MTKKILLLICVFCVTAFGANRTISLPGVWASGATTVIPEIPIKGTTYRNTSFGNSEVAAGWPFDTLVYSEYFNQYEWEMSYLMRQLEQQGILSWCPIVTYSTGALAQGSDNNIYIALQSNSNNDPTSPASSSYWRIYLQPATLLVSGVVRLSNTYSGISESNAVTEKALSNGLDTTVKTAGNQTIGGIKTFTSFPITPSGPPTASYQVANKYYVDNSAVMVHASSDWSTSATDWIDTDLALNITTKKSKMLLMFSASAGGSANVQKIGLRFMVDGVAVTTASFGNVLMQINTAETTCYQKPITAQWLVTGLVAGTHTIKLQIKSEGGTAVLGQPGVIEDSERVLIAQELD